MLNYEALDAAADSYIPLLGVIWLAVIGQALLRREWLVAFSRFALGVGLLSVAYGLMWIDNTAGIWPALGLDYSTHASVAFALVTILGLASRPLRTPIVASLFAYFGLMLFQRYHSAADIASTIAVVAVPFAVLAWQFGKKARLPVGFRNGS